MTRRISGVAADLVFLDLGQRAAKYLAEHGCGPPREVRITQAELASAIGASRQRVNVCLQEFQRKRLDHADTKDDPPRRPRRPAAGRGYLSTSPRGVAAAQAAGVPPAVARVPDRIAKDPISVP
jgi:hypothetical protein